MCKLVPEDSTYVSWSNLDHDVVSTWHAVYWPPRQDQDDFVVYEYCDTNFRHAWAVNVDFAHFEDENEAVQFALLFGGGQPHGSDT